MKDATLETRLRQELLDFINSRRSLQLSSIQPDGAPYASYAPFAIGDDCLYVLLSEIAVHAVNLQSNPRASVLIIEDEDSAGELFARIRVNYSVQAERLKYGSNRFKRGLQALVARHGERPGKLSELRDFKLFRLTPTGGRYVKGFGRAYNLVGNSLAGENLSHLRVGHKARSAM